MIKFTLFLLVALVAQNDGSFLPFRRLEDRIIGGSTTPIEEIPYQLSLMSISSYGSHICGATIISSTWCITAAHCLYDGYPYYLSLRAGSSRKGSKGTIHQAVELVVHPNYNRRGIDWDYGLLKVREPFPLGTPGVAAIQMAWVEPKEGEVAMTSGWGRLSSPGLQSGTLQSAMVPLISRESCRAMINEKSVTDRMLCTGLEEGGVDACQGDDGGPLVVNNLLVGVVSLRRMQCAGPRSPGIYANIANQRSWIQEVTGV